MKKYMTMPDVKIVRFDTNDIIVTSGVSTLSDTFEESDPTLTQGRNSLWD